MSKRLAVVAGTGIAICLVCLGFAAAIDDISPGGLFGRCRELSGDAGAGSTREIAWESDSDEVTINVPSTVTYRPGSGTMLIARGSPEALGHLRVRGKRIEFDCRGWDLDGDLDLTLPGQPLNDFTLNGKGRLILENINTRELDIALHGKGEVEATGTAEDVDLTMAGDGEAHLGKLAAKSVEVRIAGNGDAEIAPEDEADIMIAGSGVIRLLTQPRSLEQTILGSGKIVQAPAPPASAP
jgi:hypothetical protein